MVKTDNTAINRVKDLNGKKVATEQDSTAADRIAQVAPRRQGLLFPDDAAVRRRR